MSKLFITSDIVLKFTIGLFLQQHFFDSIFLQYSEKVSGQFTQFHFTQCHYTQCHFTQPVILPNAILPNANLPNLPPC